MFAVSGDLNRNEVLQIKSFINNGKKIIIVLNKIYAWNKQELNAVIKNINSKLPKELNIPVIINTGNNIKMYIVHIMYALSKFLGSTICNSRFARVAPV